MSSGSRWPFRVVQNGGETTGPVQSCIDQRNGAHLSDAVVSSQQPVSLEAGGRRALIQKGAGGSGQHTKVSTTVAYQDSDFDLGSGDITEQKQT